MSTPTRARFTWDDLLAFREASHDTNPLHTDPAYAARTHFGGPVVFGVLGGLAALAAVPQEPGQALQELDLEFRAAAFPDVDYALDVATRRRKTSATLRDAGRLLTKVSPRFAPGSVPRSPAEAAAAETAASPPTATLQTARRGPSPGPGHQERGDWEPAWAALAALAEGLAIPQEALSLVHLAAAAFSSYLVGMALPGEAAVFWRTTLDFSEAVAPAPGAWTYEAEVTEVDGRFSLLSARFSLDSAAGPVARGTVQAFVRQAVSAPSAPPRSAGAPRLSGTSALVIGASRGLGAALVRGLSVDGVAVTAGYRSDAAGAEALRDDLPPEAASIALSQGDGGDPAWCARAVADHLERNGGLDLLLCNASPPLRPLSLGPESLPRLQAYVTASLALVAEPLAAALPALEARGGTVVFISSSAVTDPPAEWPHYVAAKAAAEGLLRTAAAAFPKVRVLVLRPPRLKTGFTFNATDALAPEAVVETLVGKLVEGAAGASGGWELVEDVDWEAAAP